MLDTRRLTSVALVAALLIGDVALGGAAQAQRRNFCAVVRVRPRACLVVSGGVVDRVDFDISSARPVPRRGWLIAGAGVERGFSTCIRADRRLSQVTWRRVNACPQAR